MAMTTKTLLIAASGLAVLAACSTDNGSGNSGGWNSEAGAFIDGGNFGNPTAQNTAVQSGQADFAINLNRRFSEEVPSTVNFAFDSAVLDGVARDALMKQAAWIKAFPEVTFRVYGHTDLVGTEEYNNALGKARANAVVSFFVSQGISKSRLEALVSFGERQPLVVTEGQEPRNRRTVTEVSGFVKNHPGVLHGKYANVIFRGYPASAGSVSNIEGGLSEIGG